MAPTIEEEDEIRVYCIIVAGTSEAVRIRAETMCRKRQPNRTPAEVYILKRDGQKVGEIDAAKVVGWWIEERSVPSAAAP